MKASVLLRIICCVLVAMTLYPASAAENVQETSGETVFLTEAAKRILQGDLDERYDGAEEGVADMRYVMMPSSEGDIVVGVRLRYPSAVALSALSLDTYEVEEHPHNGLFVNTDGVWGHAETDGAYVFLMFSKTVPLYALTAATEPFDPECGPHIAIRQTETIWLSNGSYVPGHRFFATDGMYPDTERVHMKNSLVERGGRSHKGAVRKRGP